MLTMTPTPQAQRALAEANRLKQRADDQATRVDKIVRRREGAAAATRFVAAFERAMLGDL